MMLVSLITITAVAGLNSILKCANGGGCQKANDLASFSYVKVSVFRCCARAWKNERSRQPMVIGVTVDPFE